MSNELDFSDRNIPNAKPGGWVWRAVAFLTIAAAVTVAVGAGAWLFSKQNNKGDDVAQALKLPDNDTSAELASLEDAILAREKAQFVKRVSRQWERQDLGPAFDKRMASEFDNYDDPARRMMANHATQYGKKHIKLSELSVDRNFEIETVEKLLDRAIERILKDNEKNMADDLAEMRNQLKIDNPLILSKPLGHDQSTVLGRKLFEEEEILLIRPC